MVRPGDDDAAGVEDPLDSSRVVRRDIPFKDMRGARERPPLDSDNVLNGNSGPPKKPVFKPVFTIERLHLVNDRIPITETVGGVAEAGKVLL